ncbi:asparagine synthase (glutamine-hydrolyzing) [Kibdelosporangium banguiense]|uniref:asparagine synthase (glutamine-hydrolyzing) n=1 Tax=Kibdelosporangium banguiense TaxID=1365924 RepID=A0ABS4TS79_9PSEU|nr:asparagine synthase (glutamine-hydrolyzing) [Kibdelosporangium banguiense]MBP2327272.1 asparagine synthase (glutamine-hydrolyzing) [Kibdelosporangium banguiense]
MCGVTGWVDFRRDLAGQRPILSAMTEALGARGVDDRGLWLDGHAGLGHTRTAIIDPVGATQPMTADENGHTAAVLSYNGEVYNFKQLRTELKDRGHDFRTRSDTEVVLRSYLEWGADCARHLEGIFAFAVWDPRIRRLLLVRDRFGVKPLFYAPLPDGVLFGSEPKALLAHPAVRPVVDLDGLRELFSIAKQPGQAVFRDMREVPPGHTLTVDRDGITARRYWQLEARPHTDSLDSTISTVRSLLEDIVLRELVADVPLCTALSGGLDSSAVTALAAKWMWQISGERVRTFSVTFDGYSEGFRPDDARSTADAPYAAEMAAYLRSGHTDIVLRTPELMDAGTRAAALWAQDIPSTLGDMDTSNYLTFGVVRRHSTVALSGEVADEIFGGYNWMFNPAFVRADTFPWVVNEASQPGARQGQGRGLFDRGVMQKLAMTEYYADSYRQALAEVPHQDDESSDEHRMRSVSHVTLTHWMPLLLDRGDRLTMAHGLEMRVPYADHRLVEYLYNTPWSFKTFDGREKSLLRAAVRDLLPESVLARKKSPWPVTQDPVYTQALRDELALLLADKDAPVVPLLDTDAARKVLEHPDGVAMDWPSRMNVETALRFDHWLRRYQVELVL